MRSSFFRKMIIFHFILTTIPVIWIGTFSYVKSSDEIQSQVNASNMQLLKQTSTNVEQILKTVNHTLDQLITSTVTKAALDHPLNAYDFMLYNDFRSELGHLQSFDTLLNDVVIVNPKENWIVKNSGVYRLNEYSKKEPLLQQLDLPNNSTWILNPSHWFFGEEINETQGCKYTISLVKKLPATGSPKYGLAYANIPTCKLVHFLDFKPGNNEQFMILDEHNQILLHPDKKMIGKSVLQTGYIKDAKQLTAPEGRLRTELENNHYTISYFHSKYNNWNYVSIISIDNLTKESKKIGLFTLYICLIIFLLSLFLGWLGTRRMYSPIQKLLTLVGDRIPDVKEKKINEFQIISEHVQRLFASKSQLEKEVHDHLQQVRAYFLIKWLQGNIRTKEIIEKMNLFGYSHQLETWKSLAVITLQIDSLENSRYEKQDAELLLFAINNILEEIVPAENRLNPIIIDQTQVTIIGSMTDDPKDFNKQVFALTESVQQTIHNYLDLHISIGISLPFHQLREAPQAYHEGLDALRQRIKLGEGVIIQYENFSSDKHYMYVNYPRQKENELIEAIKLADQQKAKEMLGRFMTAIFELELSPQEYQIPLVRLLNNLLNVMQESGITLNQIRNSSLFEELLALQIASEIEEWFCAKIVFPLIAIFRDRQESQYHSISEKIIDIIQKQYDTDLTIEKCASELHYNANYLSSVFRKETNLSFSEYLTIHRFNMAKKWLSEGEMTVKTIAEKLRYNNSQNFIRSFRKVEGMTPGQYREKYGKDAN